MVLSLCLFRTRCVYETCHDQSRCFETRSSSTSHVL